MRSDTISRERFDVQSIPCRFLEQLARELRDNLLVNRVVREASALVATRRRLRYLWCTVSQRDRVISQGRDVYYERLKGVETAVHYARLHNGYVSRPATGFINRLTA